MLLSNWAACGQAILLTTYGASTNYKLLLNPKPKPTWNNGEPPSPSGQRYISRGARMRITIYSLTARKPPWFPYFPSHRKSTPRAVDGRLQVFWSEHREASTGGR